MTNEAARGFQTYAIWRRYHGPGEWVKTSRTIKARTDNEAQSRMRAQFKDAQFTSMSLLAVRDGEQPK